MLFALSILRRETASIAPSTAAVNEELLPTFLKALRFSSPSIRFGVSSPMAPIILEKDGELIPPAYPTVGVWIESEPGGFTLITFPGESES